jgi:hypothetical protein
MIRSCVKVVKGYCGGAGSGARTEEEFFEELMALNEF